MGRPYYFFGVEKLDLIDGILATQDQKTFGRTIGVDEPPHYEIRMEKPDFYKGLTRLKCISETVERRPHRLFGDPEYTSTSIVGGDRFFYAFWHPLDRYIIFNAGRRQVGKLLKQLQHDYPGMISLTRGEVNFPDLLPRIRNPNVVGTWFGGMKGQIKSMAIFGDHVDITKPYSEWQGAATMTAIIVEFSWETGARCQLMVLQHCGVVIYDPWELERDLDLLLSVKPLLFGEASE